MRRGTVIGAVLMLVSAALPATTFAQQGATPAGPPTVEHNDDAAFGQFATAVADYIKLRHALGDEVPPLKVTANPAEYIAASDMLAVAIQRARPQARQGDFFKPDVRRVIQARIAEALRDLDFAAITGLNDPEEKSQLATMRTYSRFPEGGPLATMPPSVLQVLPQLPDSLEYRFVGRDLVLRDSHARLILDFIPNAVAP
jgi:hypothetical protein